MTKRLTNQRMAELGQSEIPGHDPGLRRSRWPQYGSRRLRYAGSPRCLKKRRRGYGARDATAIRGSMDCRNYGKASRPSWTETTAYRRIPKQTSRSAQATGAFHSACMALLNPGDEVIVFQPYYQYHISALLAVEARPVIVPTTGPTDV